MSELLRYPAPSLLLPCLPVTRWGVGILPMVNDLKQSRDDIDHLGVDAFGLAAPQIGIQLRMFVWRGKDGEDHIVTNPQLLESDGVQYADEQCLSMLGPFDTLRGRWLPGLELQVCRHDQIKVAFMDEWGDPKIVETDGLVSRMFQHEMDHLDGVTMLDRVSAPVRKQAVKRFEKLHQISIPKSPRKVAA
jgi:peptide deformylase